MSKFEKAFEAMKRLQRGYTTVRINNDMGSLSRDAMKDLRDLVEELVVEAYGPPDIPLTPGVILDFDMVPGKVYEVDPKAIPPGFILIDEPTLRAHVLAQGLAAGTESVLAERIRGLFNKS
jgi:hypothetical protein